MVDPSELLSGSTIKTAELTLVSFRLPNGRIVEFLGEDAVAMIAQAWLDSPTGGEASWESLQRQAAERLNQELG